MRPRTKKQKLNPIIVRCTQCFTCGWTCEDNTPCLNCTLRDKEDCSKRVMCKHYADCKNDRCTFAHEGNSLAKVIIYTRLRAKPSGPAPSVAVARIWEGESEGGGVEVGAVKDWQR